MKANASVAEWYRTHGRHPVHAKDRDLPLPAYDNAVTVREHELAITERAEGRRPRRTKHLPVVG